VSDTENAAEPEPEPAAAPADPAGSERPPPFDPQQLDKTVIALPLLAKLEKERAEGGEQVWAIVIDINLEHGGGRTTAMEDARKLIEDALKPRAGEPSDDDGTSFAREPSGDGQGIHERKSARSQQYLFARLKGDVIREVVRRNDKLGRPIFRIWPDFPIRPLINCSISTVKADAARVSFSAFGKGIVWAVVDSGIDPAHPQFKHHTNVLQSGALAPLDFTDECQALVDGYGHGTHVAGIIAGELVEHGGNADDEQVDPPERIRGVSRHRDADNQIVHELVDVPAMTGMAPQCKLLSLKVLNSYGQGDASNIIAALQYVQELNGYGRRLVVHGVNLSVGYPFEPEWFACGQSPLCVEVEQLVRSGVVVVVAAGNTGYGYNATEFDGSSAAGLGVTINDPGNAELAITVGSTHRDMPHVYGVSYFSSKGPTGDGRSKPDLVAPGEKIMSAAAGARRAAAEKKVGVKPHYVEDSGTSMAAPHVSGVIAAFLSVRREFIGRPDRVKEIFLSTATDLKRDRHFQGHGLVDMMRAIQSV
jgi:serine protease AprX